MSDERGQRFPDIVVQGLAVDEGDVLMIKRGSEPYKGLWSLPGGRLELRETLENAVRREVLEETAVEVEVVEQIGIFESVDTPNHFIIIGYSARVVGKRDAVGGDDAHEARWVPPNEVHNLDLSPDSTYFLERGLNG